MLNGHRGIFEAHDHKLCFFTQEKSEICERQGLYLGVSQGRSLKISMDAKATPTMLGPVWAARAGDM